MSWAWERVSDSAVATALKSLSKASGQRCSVLFQKIQETVSLFIPLVLEDVAERARFFADFKSEVLLWGGFVADELTLDVEIAHTTCGAAEFFEQPDTLLACLACVGIVGRVERSASWASIRREAARTR